MVQATKKSDKTNDINSLKKGFLSISQHLYDVRDQYGDELNCVYRLIAEDRKKIRELEAKIEKIQEENDVKYKQFMNDFSNICLQVANKLDRLIGNLT